MALAALDERVARVDMAAMTWLVTLARERTRLPPFREAAEVRREVTELCGEVFPQRVHVECTYYDTPDLPLMLAERE